MKAKSHNEDSAILKRIARPIVIGACVGAISCLLVLLVMAAVMAAQNIPKAAGFAVLQDVRGTTILVKLAVMVASGAVGGIIGVNMKRRR